MNEPEDKKLYETWDDYSQKHHIWGEIDFTWGEENSNE